MRILIIAIVVFAWLAQTLRVFATPVTTLVPNKARVENPVKKPDKTDPYPDEVDALISLLEPNGPVGVNMDMPQLFAVIRRPPAGENNEKSERQDILSDVEEIRYLDKKAWGANVSVKKPGLYQLILESKPWWDEDNDVFRQDLAKVTLPSGEHPAAWNEPAGQLLEIIPLSRPYAIFPPAVFNGVVLVDGKPGENILVRLGRINTGKTKAADESREARETKTDAGGGFSFILTEPGWHYARATIVADPLKGPDGQPKPLRYSSVFWFYVDPPATEKNGR